MIVPADVLLFGKNRKKFLLNGKKKLEQAKNLQIWKKVLGEKPLAKTSRVFKWKET